jgi:predicted Zn-dependent peptidase
MFKPFAGALAAMLLATSALSQPARPASVDELVGKVDIPYQEFTLSNGLRVIVHTDRKAPIVAVSVWYHIGSKDEPAGKTGFAHLFEHLMFNGSENANHDFFQGLEQVGATDYNGTTWFDRTNYFETVPTGALDYILFLEADRMGHLLGAIDQAKLTNQIGVVQNEKRQGDNQPFGLVDYAQYQALFPEGHPYRHSTIGSMADLSRASLADVKAWFGAHYGPNNATLVLAGDVDAATARAAVERYFGKIPSGPETARLPVSVPTLKAPVDQVMTDRVANTRIYRSWTAPGVNDPGTAPLSVALTVLGGLSSSRLDNIFVRQDKTAVSVSAGLQEFEKVSIIDIQVDVKPGADANAVAAKLDRVIADYLRSGPSADEVQRAATSVAAGTIAGLEQVGGFGGKAVALAEGAVYSDDPARYKKDLAALAKVTPEGATAAARKWMGRPAYRLVVSPGDRSPSDIAMSGGSRHRGPFFYQAPGAPAPNPEAAAAAPTEAPPKDATPPKDAAPSAPPPATLAPPEPQPAGASKLGTLQPPPVKQIADLTFPTIERARLSNGVEVVFARRTAVPTVRVALAFDAGNAADPRDKLGTQALMLGLLDEGTTTRNSIQIAEEKERLGAGISASASKDTTTISMLAMTPNLAPTLDLLADIARSPAFAPGEVERLRGQLMANVAAEKSEPAGIARRILPGLLYGPAHPYGGRASGTEASLATITRADLAAFHQRWIRPDNMRIFVVGDTTLGEITRLLEPRFGTWAAPSSPKGAKLFRMDRMARVPRIVLVDRPQSPQSYIMGGELLPFKGTDDPLAFQTGNEVLGGSFLSRLNTNLRETKGWAYGVYSGASAAADTMAYTVVAPVQADKTGDSLRELLSEMKTFITTKGIDPAAELPRTINNQIRSLPGSFETSDALLGAMVSNATLGRPDDYYTGLAGRYRAFTAPELDRAVRAAVRPQDMIWVVVGDAKLVRPQLEGLGLPIEMGQIE